MSIDEKYLPDQESYFLQYGKQRLVFKQAGRMQIIQKAVIKRRTPFRNAKIVSTKSVSVVPGVGRRGQLDDTTGELGLGFF